MRFQSSWAIVNNAAQMLMGMSLHARHGLCREGENPMKTKKTNPRRKPATMADINKAMKQASRDLSIAAIVFTAMSLHDVYGFGPKRLEAFVVNVLHKFRDWDAGLFTTDDALEWFEDYTGMEIRELVEVDNH